MPSVDEWLSKKDRDLLRSALITHEGSLDHPKAKLLLETRNAWSIWS